MKDFQFVPEGVENCSVQAWLHNGEESGEMKARQKPAMVICPGGGYGMVSAREAEPVAMPFYSAGYNVFVLTYSILEQAKDFKPLCQLAATVAHIRKYSEQWLIDPNKVAVCGFSAGGHLAGSLGTLFNEPRFMEAFGRQEDVRPNAMVLGYPVITSDEYAHQGSIRYVSGEEPGSEGYKWFGLDKHVDEDTPPVFLWHTSSDRAVPVENSIKMAAALSKSKVPFEMHIFPEGNHGMSVCSEEVGSFDPYNARWVQWSIQWLNRLFSYDG